MICFYFCKYSYNMSDFVKADSRNLPKVENVMILEYITTSSKHNVAEIRGVKILMSSRDSYLSTAVGYVQVSRSGHDCIIKAKVVPEHRVSGKLYNVSCKINEQNDVIIDSSCEDCAAAAGGCKHSLLLLFWLEKKTSEPSPTSTVCYWNKPCLSSVRNEHVSCKDIFVKTKKPKLGPKNNSVLKDLQGECEKRKIKISLIVDFNENLTKDSKNIFDMMLAFVQEVAVHDYNNFKEYLASIISKEVIIDIEKKTIDQANSKYWHNIRQGRLTASILHEAAHCDTAGTLVERILGGYKVPETKAIQRGKRLESGVFNEVARKLNITMRKSGFVLINGILGASPDGVGDDFVLEVKCPASEKSFCNYIKNGVLQKKFKTQIQCQMLACGKRRGLFCVASLNFETNKEVHLLWEDFDDAYIKNIIDKAEGFWQKFIFPKLLASAI